MAEYIRVICPCGKKLKAPISFAGKEAKCPACGRMIPVPFPEPPTSPEDWHVPEPEIKSPLPPTNPPLPKNLIALKCKTCGGEIIAKKYSLKVRCPHCQNKMRVPIPLSTQIIAGVMVLLLASCCIWSALLPKAKKNSHGVKREITEAIQENIKANDNYICLAENCESITWYDSFDEIKPAERKDGSTIENVYVVVGKATGKVNVWGTHQEAVTNIFFMWDSETGKALFVNFRLFNETWQK